MAQLKGIGGKKQRRNEVASTSTSIVEENNITPSFQAMQHLRGLEYLEISDCPCLDLFAVDDYENALKFQNLESLTHLSILYMEGLERLPRGLQYVSTLQALEIEECRSLVALPEEISNLESLQDIQIIRCESLHSLPKGMRCLCKLQQLTILDCDPYLLKRCEKQTGSDWLQIADVPRVFIRASSSEKWKLKLHVACTSRGRHGPIGIGGLLRDEIGSWVTGYYGRLPDCPYKEAGIKSIHQGLKIIQQKHNGRGVVINTDCDAIIGILGSAQIPGTNLSPLIKECKFLVESCSFSFQSTSQEDNRCAHELVELGIDQQEELVILDEPPPELYELLHEEQDRFIEGMWAPL